MNEETAVLDRANGQVDPDEVGPVSPSPLAFIGNNQDGYAYDHEGTLRMMKDGAVVKTFTPDQLARMAVAFLETPSDPIPEVERISVDDKMWLDQMNAEVRSVNEHVAFVIGMLTRKYKMNPQQDRFEDDGRITRAKVESE